jgi:CBS domain-containing protein
MEGVTMSVIDMIRTDVVALHPADPIDAARRRMQEAHLDTLPVTESSGRLVGLLTETDLLSRPTPRRAPRWWNTAFAESEQLAANSVKAFSVTVSDLMRLVPPAIGPDASVEAAAALMRRHALAALPVVADEICVGIVTRRDLLARLSWPGVTAPRPLADTELERAMLDGIERAPWTSRHRVVVEATHGVIRLGGVVASPAERAALVAMARSRPGCSGVDDRLVVLAALRPALTRT